MTTLDVSHVHTWMPWDHDHERPGCWWRYCTGCNRIERHTPPSKGESR